MSLLEAISPTARLLLAMEHFLVGYTWNDPLLGELTGNRVVTAIVAEAALASFKSKNRHVTAAWIITQEKLSC